MKASSCVVGVLCGIVCVAGFAAAEPPPALGAGPREMGGQGREGGMRPNKGEFMRQRGEGAAEHPDGMLMRVLMNPKMAQDIGLSEDQVSALRLAMEDIRKKEIDLTADLEKNALVQARLLTTNMLDEAAILAQVEKAGALRTEIAKLKIRQLLLVRKSLSPEQMAKVREGVRQHMERRGEGGGGMTRERIDEMRRQRGGEGGMMRGPREGAMREPPPPPPAGESAR